MVNKLDFVVELSGGTQQRYLYFFRNFEGTHVIEHVVKEPNLSVCFNISSLPDWEKEKGNWCSPLHTCSIVRMFGRLIYLFSIYYFAWIKMALLSSKRILSPLLSFHQVYLIIYSTLISSGVMILTKSHSEAYFAYSCDLS